MSSNDIAVSVRGLSKSYTIAHEEQHSTLAETLLHRAKSPLQRAEKETFWALKDIEFDIKQGDVVGIIGRNGAGKSTLLKVLSQITEPTTGEIDLYGRVGSLLEVGTGFHPELTGRENIYLNGAILGMRRKEIDRQFDAIVEFSGVEQFLDTPVKRYSSGMYVRLAFAVAAHLNPEILIVDEVLAVGDAEFQKKCLGKMQDVAHSGRTVLFVSHNMDAVRNLCSQGIVLSNGKIACYGGVIECLDVYKNLGLTGRTNHWQLEGNKKSSDLYVSKVSVELQGKQPYLKLLVAINLESASSHKPAFLALDILSSSGTVIMQAVPRFDGFIHAEDRQHLVHSMVDLPPLIPGKYFVTLWTGSHNTETLDEVNECVAFEITDSPSADRNYPHTVDHGYIVPSSSVEYTNVEYTNMQLSS